MALARPNQGTGWSKVVGARRLEAETTSSRRRAEERTRRADSNPRISRYAVFKSPAPAFAGVRRSRAHARIPVPSRPRDRRRLPCCYGRCHRDPTGAGSQDATSCLRHVLEGGLRSRQLTKMNLPFETSEEVADIAQGMLQPFPVNEYPSLVEFISEHAMKPGYDYGDEFEVRPRCRPRRDRAGSARANRRCRLAQGQPGGLSGHVPAATLYGLLEGTPLRRLPDPTNVARYVRDRDQQRWRRSVGSNPLAPTIPTRIRGGRSGDWRGNPSRRRVPGLRARRSRCRRGP
jgi:hypothetical protein